MKLSTLSLRFSPIIPGFLLAIVVAVTAITLGRLEKSLTGGTLLEALVLAILLGALVRTNWNFPVAMEPGIRTAAKTPLEIAVALMGALFSGSSLAQMSLPFIIGIVVLVVGAIGASYLIGRALGLPQKISMLVACGNAICGNSAIAAVAPVIDADGHDVAASIAFTAVFGIVVVIALPFAVAGLGLSAASGGIFAGLTVYAVPQVITAAAPLGPVAVQLGTLVKLIRVLMLGPVVAALSLIRAGRASSRGGNTVDKTTLVPWFIIGFVALAAIRSIFGMPTVLIAPLGRVTDGLTILAMAGLGLGVDLRQVTAAGPRVTAAVILSLLLLAGEALALLNITGAGMQ